MSCAWKYPSIARAYMDEIAGTTNVYLRIGSTCSSAGESEM
nr:hypothetical protein [Actinomadura madurae]